MYERNMPPEGLFITIRSLALLIATVIMIVFAAFAAGFFVGKAHRRAVDTDHLFCAGVDYERIYNYNKDTPPSVDDVAS